MMPRARASIAALVAGAMCLSACDQHDGAAEKEKKPAKSSTVIAEDLYDFKPAPPPPPTPPPAPVPVVEPPQIVHVPEPSPPPLEPQPAPIAAPKFEDPAPMLRALAARNLRADRQQAGASNLLPLLKAPGEAPSLEANWKLKDPNYQQREPRWPEDRSTLPVDRFRVVTADRYIGAILENAVNSQIPGRIIAVVERNIYGADGRLPLLPKGTRIICDYKNLAKVGESRLPVICARALRPDGASIQLTDAQGADQMARTGLIGDVDLRIWERYGSAFIVAAISSLASLGSQVSPSNQTVSQGGNALSQNLGQVTAKVLEQSVDLAPIVSVPAASRIQIIPRTDIWLREPEPVSRDAAGTGQ
jgi:type IV secretion system protein VirB10